MTDPESPFYQRPWMLWLIVPPVLFVIGYFLIQAVSAPWSRLPDDASPVAQQERNQNALPSLTSENNRSVPLDTPTDEELTRKHEQAAKQLERQRIAMARAKLQEIADLADEARAAVKQLSAEFAAWDQQIVPLLTNAKGKSLAASMDRVRAFEIHYSSERPPRTRAEKILARVNILAEPIETALRDDPTSLQPSPELVEQLTRQREQAIAMLKPYRTDRQFIEQLVDDAQRENLQGTVSLEETMDLLHAEQRRQQSDKIQAAREEARRANDKRLAEAERDRLTQQGKDKEAKFRAETQRQHDVAEAERQKLIQQGKDEKARIEAETERQRTLAEAEKKEIEADAERKRLLKLAQDPAVQARFAPFLSDGRYVMGTSPKRYYQIPQPVSYARLKRMGALKSPLAFANAGAGKPFGWNDRPSWKAPSSKQEVERYAQLLKQFQELAPIWIELGKLKP